jgi:hypothetical protein
MIIRVPHLSDKQEIDRLYTKFFSKNEYPDFLNSFQCSFVVADGHGIILAGGVKLIAEAVVVTDQERPVRVRQEALIQALGSSIFIAEGMKFRQIHAFVNNDEEYARHLQKFGFKLIDAKLLMLDFGETHG